MLDYRGKELTMSPRVVQVTREDLMTRMDAILGELGIDLDQFRHLAATRKLSGAEWEAKQQLDEIEFLLGSRT